METSADRQRGLALAKQALPDLLAFGLGLWLAWVLHWSTTDLVWSLWLSSLVVGYLTILLTIGGGVAVGVLALSRGMVPAKDRLPMILGGSFLALFMLGFFSIHFCSFHAGHAVFLSMFFPLSGFSSSAFGDAFMNPLALWDIVFKTVAIKYGAFLVPVLLAERKHVFTGLATLRDFLSRASSEVPGAQPLLTDQEVGAKDLFARPYLNVVRMHLLIFFFAGCHALKIESFFVYAVVYAVYFFPWSLVLAIRKSDQPKPCFRANDD